ncbi:transmembrane protein C1orf162 homolog [Carlito syrichta]|uniref:Transmembrane protein C1orf162 homolog n=1 Tax=Carlito syrichta TaxID=1868482 RepID=A0A3Q0EHE5_CARSF|nr:transmembrane protein C1orf162 homolog [Carlito syrichta]
MLNGKQEVSGDHGSPKLRDHMERCVSWGRGEGERPQLSLRLKWIWNSKENVENQRVSVKEHLLAFFTGVLLTLLLTALVLLILKCCRKRHSSFQAQQPHWDPPAKLSPIPGESLTYASMTFKPSEEKGGGLTENHSADFDPVVYSQIKATNSPYPPSEI